MARLGPVLLGLGFGGVIIALARESLGTVNWGPMAGGKSSPRSARSIKDAAKKLSKEVRASATKWAKARGIPVIDVLTTIVLESRGNPKAHALTAKEDSRGAMQVNVRAHADALKTLGYTPDDLYKLDVGIEVGTYVLAAKRKAVMNLLKSTSRKQTLDLATLVRLYYAGPKYAAAYITKGTHFKNMEAYIDHWKEAKQAVAEAFAEGTYA